MSMSPINEVVTRVSDILNDQFPGNEFVRWGRVRLEHAYKEAMSVIALVRPDLTLTPVDVELKPGTAQDIKSVCASISSVIGIIDEDGNVQRRPTKGKDELSKWFTKNSALCIADPSEYTVNTYEIDASDGHLFVSPPVPKGAKVKLRVMCAGGCGPIDDCRYEAPIVEYMIYRLLSGEEDSATSRATADKSLSNFVTLLSLSHKMKVLIESGEVHASGTIQSPVQ